MISQRERNDGISTHVDVHIADFLIPPRIQMAYSARQICVTLVQRLGVFGILIDSVIDSIDRFDEFLATRLETLSEKRCAMYSYLVYFEVEDVKRWRIKGQPLRGSDNFFSIVSTH